MTPLVDYDEHQHRVYRQARELPAVTVAERMRWFQDHVGDVAPEPILDLGSGTGRFTFPLASTFRTRTIGVEPSLGMLAEACEVDDDDRATFVAGRAERLPLRDGSVVAAFVLNVLHHVDDRPAAARELARVVTATGLLVVTGSVTAEYHLRLMARWFPSYPALAARVLPTTDELEEEMASGGWRVAVADRLVQPLATTLSEYAERVALRGQSLLELLPDDEFHAGVAAMREEARDTEPAPVVDHYDCFVFSRHRAAGVER